MFSILPLLLYDAPLLFDTASSNRVCVCVLRAGETAAAAAGEIEHGRLCGQ